MIDRITELLNELEQEINDGYNTMLDYQTNDEVKLISMGLRPHCMNYKNKLKN